MKNYFIYLIVIAFISCGIESNKESNKSSNSTTETTTKDSKESRKKKEEKEKLEKLIFYTNNSSITDENGIKYKLSVKDVMLSKKPLYTSEAIHYENRYDSFDIFIKSYRITTIFKMFSNGELVDKIKLDGVLLESKRSDKNGLFTRCSDSYTYYPKLESDEVRKRKIAGFTGENCGLGAELNNKVRNERIKAVKASGILK